MSIFFNYNGRFYKEGTPVITPQNRSLRYGDGLFETIKMVNGRMLLKDYHFERLFYGMQVLAFDVPAHFTALFLENEIIALAKKNNQNNAARIRLMVFKGNGGLHESYDQLPDFIIQTSDITGVEKLNSDGLLVDVYPDVKKSCDMLANIKTNNFLPYALAATYARRNLLNDCILLNTGGRICDTTIANIFIIKDEIIYTPALTEGCIAGVMRRYIIENCKCSNINILEKPVTLEDLETADEAFVTNSIHPMRWIKQFQNVTYTNKQIQHLYTIIDQTF